MKLKVLAAMFVACVLFPLVQGAEESVNVQIKGVLHEDKNGFFIRANGGVFDLYFTDEGRADMHKFHSSLEGDMVSVSGTMRVQQDKGRDFLMVYATDISRLKGEKVVVREVPEQPVIIRDRYIEREHGGGIHLPGIHIHW